MILRPIAFAVLLITAPIIAVAQSAPECDPTITSCPNGNAGVNVDP